MSEFDEKTMPIIVLTGCTGSGKSKIGVELAKKIDGYIINADSKQVYKEIPIASAQPVPEEMLDNSWLIDGVEHYLYGMRSIKDQYTIQQFQRDVYHILKKKISTDQVPILLGGSGLYIESIIHNFQLEKESAPDPEKREKLMNLDIDQLQRIAEEKIKSLNESDRLNPIRLVRLIERNDEAETGEKREYTYFVVELGKEQLHARNRERVESMIGEGLENEVSQFKNEIINKDPQFQIIGLQEFRDYFLGNATMEEVMDLISTHTNQYAKRQRTWFKREKQAIYVSNFKEILPYLKATS